MADGAISDKALDQLFRTARSFNTWSDDAVDPADFRRIFETAIWGPTTSNSNPARFVFVHSAQGKERLRPFLSPGNVDKTMSAPCTVIIAWDEHFYQLMPQLFLSRDMSGVFEGKPDLIEETGFRSSSLQGAYFMLAARALGFDCGPMSGFDRAGVDAEFLSQHGWKSNFLCNIGVGTPDGLFPRNPRPRYDQACTEA